MARSIAAGFVLAVVVSGTCMGAASFQGLGLGIRAIAVSGNGRTVVGRNDNLDEAFFWSESSGVVNLGFSGTPHAASLDGSVIAGQSFKWTQSTGMIDLVGVATGISNDGSVIVGVSGAAPVYWTESGGIESLGLPTGASQGKASSVSADGTVIVGDFETPDPVDDINEGFRWTSDSGFLPLGDLPGGRFFSNAYDVSADGLTVVGQSISDESSADPGGEAFVWTGDNAARGSGGAVWAKRSLSVTDSEISENVAQSPDAWVGGIYAIGNVTVANSTISRNTNAGNSSLRGGGIYTFGNVTVTSSTISLNTLTTSNVATGGGIFASGEATVTNSTISENSLVTGHTASGGGIYASGEVTVTNSTISENSAESETVNVPR